MSPFVGNIGLSVNRTAFMVVLVLMYMAAVTTDVAVTNGGYWWIVFVKCTVNENPACRLHCCCGTRMQRSDHSRVDIQGGAETESASKATPVST